MAQAAAVDRSDVLQLVIEAEELDIEIDHPDDDGVSAMMLAANFGNLGSVRLLLAAGAALNRQSNDGTTALMLAVQNNVSVYGPLPYGPPPIRSRPRRRL